MIVIVGGGGGGGLARQRVFVDPWTKSRSQFTAACLPHRGTQWTPEPSWTQTRLLLSPGFSPPQQGDAMKRCRGLLLLLLCSGMFHQGSGLRCYKCSDYTGRCQDVQECTYEDSCISLSERGGKTIRQCIRYTDCDNSRLTQMFPAISGFTYRCCSSNLCNAGYAAATSPPVLTLALSLVGTLLSFWWCWL